MLLSKKVETTTAAAVGSIQHRFTILISVCIGVDDLFRKHQGHAQTVKSIAKA